MVCGVVGLLVRLWVGEDNDERGLMIQERVFAFVFTGLRSVADATRQISGLRAGKTVPLVGG